MRTRLQVHRETEEGPRFTCRQHPHQRAHLFQLQHLPGHPVTEAAASLWGLGAHMVTRVHHRSAARPPASPVRPPFPDPPLGVASEALRAPWMTAWASEFFFFRKSMVSRRSSSSVS